MAIHEGTSGGVDLSAHFFRRAWSLLGASGTMGLIATNTIGQGGTRLGGLRWIVVEEGGKIYQVSKDMPWPGDAAVTVSIVCIAKGSVGNNIVCGLRDYSEKQR